ncbi:MAG TPA: cytochrome c3 family protein [Daejeonella sp.]|nr:cytochrome c3 family protein [Daejeonella sp.]
MRSISLYLRSVTRALTLISALCIASVSGAFAQDAKAGAAIFKQKCTSCHAIDKKVVGPALKGINERHDEAWLIKWTKNAPAMIASGDPAAKKLYEENKPAMMTAFSELSDDDVKNIYAYIKAEENKPAAAPGGAAGGGAEGAHAEAQGGGVSNFMLIGLIAVVVIAFLVILVLNRVIGTLERLIMKKQGVEVEEEEEGEKKEKLAGLKKLAKNKKFLFFVVLLTAIVLGSFGWMTMWNTNVQTGYQPVQPIKFSHQLHAGINKIDCQYCHTGAFKSKNATIPSLNVCMNCHNYVQATEKYNGEISPEIQKIYKALDYNPDTRVYGENQKPIEWVRIHNLPEFAYFNHSQHVKVAGIECQKCHGPIQTMEEVYQYSPLTMKWCINCHKETEVNHKDNAYYDKVIAAHDRLKKGEKVTAAVLGGLECGKCHY